MYYIIVPEETQDFENRDDAIEEAQHLMNMGDCNEICVVRVTDKFTNSVHHEVVE